MDVRLWHCCLAAIFTNDLNQQQRTGCAQFDIANETDDWNSAAKMRSDMDLGANGLWILCNRQCTQRVL